LNIFGETVNVCLVSGYVLIAALGLVVFHSPGWLRDIANRLEARASGLDAYKHAYRQVRPVPDSRPKPEPVAE